MAKKWHLINFKLYTIYTLIVKVVVGIYILFMEYNKLLLKFLLYF